jgi:hypothetical protein
MMRRGTMTLLIDETLSREARHQVEAVVRAVLGLHPRADALVVSVVRLGAGRWNVFVSDPDPGQFSLLPVEAPPASYEAQIQKGLEGLL